MNWTASDTIAAAIRVLTFWRSPPYTVGEKAFSALTHMKTKYRSRLNVESDLPVCLSQIAPGIDELCKVKQAHPSN